MFQHNFLIIYANSIPTHNQENISLVTLTLSASGVVGIEQTALDQIPKPNAIVSGGETVISLITMAERRLSIKMIAEKGLAVVIINIKIGVETAVDGAVRAG